jgi:hypothetical protein
MGIAIAARTASPARNVATDRAADPAKVTNAAKVWMFMMPYLR